MPDQAVIFIGIQASGKSTFYFTQYFRTHVRINLDMLHTRHREYIFLNACLSTHQSFVVDNTNLTRVERARYLPIAKEHGFFRVGFYFRSKISEAIERNASRPAEDRIPEIGIRGAHAKLEIPSFDEGFDELNYVSIKENGEFSISPWSNEI